MQSNLPTSAGALTLKRQEGRLSRETKIAAHAWRHREHRH